MSELKLRPPKGAKYEVRTVEKTDSALRQRRKAAATKDARPEGGRYKTYGSAAVSTNGLCGRRIISCSDAPAGTIG
jgi:hypothetical protein